jgi:hypothetical protein
LNPESSTGQISLPSQLPTITDSNSFDGLLSNDTEHTSSSTLQNQSQEMYSENVNFHLNSSALHACIKSRARPFYDKQDHYHILTFDEIAAFEGNISAELLSEYYDQHPLSILPGSSSCYLKIRVPFDRRVFLEIVNSSDMNSIRLRDLAHPNFQMPKKRDAVIEADSSTVLLAVSNVVIVQLWLQQSVWMNKFHTSLRFTSVPRSDPELEILPFGTTTNHMHGK